MSIISVSCKASSTATTGHDYWFHKKQARAFGEEWAESTLVGARSQSSQHLFGLLHYSWNERNESGFWLLRRTLSDAKAITIELVQKKNAKDLIFHIYEGGFREFALASFLSLLNPEATIIFNANLTDPWHRALSNSKNPFSLFGLSGAKRVLKNLGERILLLTETPKLRELFESQGFKPQAIYPLFSSVDLDVSHLENRTTSITMFPFGDSELELCLKLVQELKEQSHGEVHKILLVPRWGYLIPEAVREYCSHLGIKFVEGALGEDDYRNIYSTTKICIFPYVGEYYRVSSSGRVLDAMALGSRAYAPEGSSTSSTIVEHVGGAAFNPSDVEGFATQLLEDLSKPHVFPSRPITARDSAVALKSLVVKSTNLKPLQLTNRISVILGLFAFCLINFGLGFRYSLGRFLDSSRPTRTLSDALRRFIAKG